MRPTHVMVANRDAVCRSCDGTGRVKLGFAITPDGQARCPGCSGAGAVTTQFLMPLEEFAKLFTWGTEHGSNEHGPTARQALFVAPPQGGEGG
jgi:DnaJ-class molecular chaperone